MEEQIKAKQRELNELQSQFDDFMESSKELELEMQQALTQTENKLNDMTKRKSILEEKNSGLQAQLSDISKQLGSVQLEFQKSKEMNSELELQKRKLESMNDELAEKLRISESTEIDLLSKLERMEEHLVFAQNDIEELKNSKLESEKRLKSELTELMAELAELEQKGTSSRENAPDAGSRIKAEEPRTDLSELTEALELEIEELKERLSDAEHQNLALNEELERAGEELIAATSANQHLKGSNDGSSVSIDQELNKQLLAATDRISELESDVTNLNAAVDDSTSLLKESEQQVVDLSEELERMNDGLIATSR